LNILIIGELPENIIPIILKSKRLSKLYTATSTPIKSLPNIEYSDFKDLVFKAKTLGIDISITIDKELIENGISDYFKQNRLNLIAVNKKWFNLERSKLITKQLATYYSINVPEIIKAPMCFPVVLKCDTNDKIFIAYSMQELILKMNELQGETTFLEEFLEGQTIKLTSLWDGESLWCGEIENLTEVQKDRLELYKTKLNFMLSDENADFIGFFTSNLIWAKNDWYLLDYKMRLDKTFELKGIDIIYLLTCAIYQKLNEIV
jgi:hypothetical protein